MSAKHKIEVFTAGCSACKETVDMVKQLAGSTHELVIHDMHKREIAERAKQQGIHRVPAVVIDGKVAECCGGSKPDENILRRTLA